MSFTNNFRLETPLNGSYDGTWDVPVNNNFVAIDQILYNIQNSNKSYSAPSGLAVGSLWYDLNWNILRFKKRNTNNPSDYVRLVDEENIGDIVGDSFVSVETITPPVPTNLTLGSNVVQYNGQVTLYSFTASWDDLTITHASYTDLDGYIIEIDSTSGPAVTNKYQLNKNTTSYTFTGLLPNTSWNVKIMSISKQGLASAWTTSVSRDINDDTTAPSAPSGVAGSTGLNHSLVTWTDVNASDLAGYEVYACTAIGTPTGTANRKAIVNKNSALISLLPNTTYYIYVRAFDRTGNYSAFSSVYTAVTSGTISSIGGNSGELELGSITILGNGSYLRSGQSAFNTGQGFFLGMVGGYPKFSIGNSAGSYLTWDGQLGALVVQGNITLGNSNSIKSGQTDFNTGNGFYLGRDASGNTKFSLGNPAGNNITYDQSTGSLNITGNLLVQQAIDYNTLDYNQIRNKPSNTNETITIKQGYVSFSASAGQAGQAYICGLSSNIPADVNGSVVYNGVNQTITKGPVFTSLQNKTGYILVALSGTPFVVSGSNVDRVFAWKSSGSWYYDNNQGIQSGPITTAILNNAILIGKITTNLTVADNISYCEIWQYGLTPDITTATTDYIGTYFGTAYTPPQLLSSPSISGSGLYANSKMMGFISNGVWKNYLDNNGKFYISGDGANNYLDWNVTAPNTLTIRGTLNASDLKAGAIKSTNYTSTTGSKIDLDAGTFNLGSKLSFDGTNLSFGPGAIIWSNLDSTTQTNLIGPQGPQGTPGLTGQSGTPAQYVIVAGEQAFKFLAGSAIPINTTIILTASLFGGLSTYSWQYWNGAAWINLSGTQNASTYSLTYNNVAWTASSLRVRCLSGTISDEITIAKLYDGNNGTNGINGTNGQGIVKGVSFIRAASAPTTPTGGTFAAPNATTAGWTDGIPVDNNQALWMSTRIFTSDGASPQQSVWTNPQKIGTPSTSAKVQFSIDGSTSWHDAPTTNDYYMRSGSSADNGTTWIYSGATKIKGETGLDAVVGYLTNESAVLPASSDGTVQSYSLASGNFKVFSGTTDVTASSVFIAYTWGNCTPTINSSTGAYSVANMTADSAAVVFQATYNGAVIQKVFTLAKAKAGATGLQGIPGNPGADGVIHYTWIRYANAANGTGISWDPTGKTYIGFAYNKTSATPSMIAEDYTWSLIQGPQGNTGVQGTPGVDGITYYTWIKYSDNADGTGLYDTPTTSTMYIGIAINKTVATESNIKTDYTWVKFKGSDGATLFNLQFTGGCAYDPTSLSSVIKVGGNNAWDASARSIESYSTGCFCSAIANQTNSYVMFGLNSDPALDSGYGSIDYAVNFQADGNVGIYESGSRIDDIEYGQYSTSTVMAITYDGYNIRYFKDGIVIRTVARTQGSPLFFDSSFYSPNCSLKSIAFGTAGLQGPQGPQGTPGQNATLPTLFNAPTGSGLFIANDHLGYYNNSAWASYIDNAGNFQCGNPATGKGIAWSQAAATLNIRGSLNADDIEAGGVIRGSHINGGTIATTGSTVISNAPLAIGGGASATVISLTDISPYNIGDSIWIRFVNTGRVVSSIDTVNKTITLNGIATWTNNDHVSPTGAYSLKVQNTADFPASGTMYIIEGGHTTKATYTTVRGNWILGYTIVSGYYPNVVGSAIIPAAQSIIVSNLANEIRFYGNNSTNVEQLASIGVTSGSSDYVIGSFGTGTTGNNRVGIECASDSKSALNAFNYAWQNPVPAIVGKSLGRSYPDLTSAGTGVYGEGDIGVYGSSPYGIGSKTGVFGSGVLKGVAASGGSYDFYAQGSGANYGPFTGSHDVLVEMDFQGEVGDIIIDKEMLIKSGVSSTLGLVKLAESQKDKSIIGVLAKILPYNDSFIPSATQGDSDLTFLTTNYKHAIVNALGEGQINVCKDGGNINIGDYICSSLRHGKGMLQDDDLLHNYTVAKAREDCIWTDEEDDIRMIACTYHCG